MRLMARSYLTVVSSIYICILMMEFVQTFRQDLIVIIIVLGVWVRVQLRKTAAFKMPLRLQAHSKLHAAEMRLHAALQNG